MDTKHTGTLFPQEFQKEIKDRFAHMDFDNGQRRIFFENSGGSLRLRESAERFAEVSEYPDCGGRGHERAHYLKSIQQKGMADARLIFNAKGGRMGIQISATRAMFDMVGTIAEYAAGTNIVTSPLEHPSVFDSTRYFSDKFDIERRVAKGNPLTGGVDPEALLSLVDKKTKLLVFMASNNITGAIYDVEAIAAGARRINPEIYIVVDCVQHAPHAVVDVEKWGVDGCNFAPYKYFGQRGYSFYYLSERLAKLPHPHVYRPANVDTGNWILGSDAYGHFADVTTIVDYVCWIGGHFTDSNDRRELFVHGMERIAAHERALLCRMIYGGDGIDGIADIENVEAPFCTTSPLDQRDLIVPVVFTNISLPDAVREYEKRDIIVFERMANSHFSENVMNEFGLEGVIRVSPIHCHGTEDIDLFLKATKDIAAIRR